jgi:hypothetical protein
MMMMMMMMMMMSLGSRADDGGLILHMACASAVACMFLSNWLLRPGCQWPA